MIIYLDTSSLVKLYIEEAGSIEVREWAVEAEILSTCAVAYPETISALYKRLRRKDMSGKEFKAITAKFSKEWNDFAIIDFDEIEAGRLVEKYGLRGFDAIHLSSSKILKNGATGVELAFSSFDRELNKAASMEGFKVLTA